jgi:hypothetical protein
MHKKKENMVVRKKTDRLLKGQQTNTNKRAKKNTERSKESRQKGKIESHSLKKPFAMMEIKSNIKKYKSGSAKPREEENQNERGNDRQKTDRLLTDK